MRRRVPALLAFAALALLPGACRDEHEGAPRVTVIGGEPKMRDPASAPLSAPDAVLVANTGQGLVRFDNAGNIVGGLAERWAVTDDGLSYIFRIGSNQWPDNRKVTAPQVARILKRSLAASSSNPLKDTLGAVDDIVAMTDRVIEIRLRTPRPNLLSLLAQPEFAVVRNGVGTGPFEPDKRDPKPGEIRLVREIVSADEEEGRRDEVRLNAAPAEKAVRAFAAGESDLVLGGTFADLPLAQQAKLPRNSLRFDPASGLFGLIPTRAGSVLDDVAVRRLLSEAIDRDAFMNAMRVPGLAARATVLEPGLEGLGPPAAPAWAAAPLAQRRPGLAAESQRQFGTEKPTIRLFLPQGPGADILFNRLKFDWGVLGINVEQAATVGGSDLKLLDTVAPSASPAWFLREFRCGAAPICDADADELLDGARNTLIPAQRSALLVEAAAKIDAAQLFIPLTAPVRWSLVSNRVQGFAGNRYARHTLIDLEQRSSP